MPAVEHITRLGKRNLANMVGLHARQLSSTDHYSGVVGKALQGPFGKHSQARFGKRWSGDGTVDFGFLGLGLGAVVLGFLGLGLGAVVLGFLGLGAERSVSTLRLTWPCDGS